MSYLEVQKDLLIQLLSAMDHSAVLTDHFAPFDL